MENVPLVVSGLALLLLFVAIRSSLFSPWEKSGATQGPAMRRRSSALWGAAATQHEHPQDPKVLIDRPRLPSADTIGLQDATFLVRSVSTNAVPRLATAAAAHPVLAVVLSRPLIGHLHHLAQQVADGDFETLVIWGELAHHCLAHLLPDPTDPRQWLKGLSQLAKDPAQARAIHVSTLVDALGIPRETVRRKLERLAAEGNVRKVPGGWVISTQSFTSPQDLA